MATPIALISDVHANLPALEAVVADLTTRASVQPFDAVYCLGDLGGYAAQPNEVQELIMAQGYPTILGNYDEGVGFEREDCGCHYVKPFDINTMDGAWLKRTGRVFATAMNLYGLCVMSVPEGMLLHSSGVRERAG